ncbi:hypothetical protein L4X63_01835 [Geomonas sp. Red32]|uniref:hypothetical protein n=1 Tax=Geomonas sp. Red32 TaxID=2912856 RepID=UPI00202CFFAC|nr:hypothetical protein [Geomonas sp. Red32]MCM0080318.1 hypothetical protein [Geomonas sp. Red32]
MLAWELVRTAQETEGYTVRLEALTKEVEEAMQAEVEPLLARAFSALDEGQGAQAELRARQVLQLWPENKGARTVLARLDAGRRTAEAGELWERLGQAEGCEERLDLLEKLLVRDGQNHERILELVEVEKNRKKEQAVQVRLDRLPTLVAEGAWPEVFDTVWWLRGQEKGESRFRQACSLSPYLSVLCDNRRLDKVSERGTRQLWLDFVKAAATVRAGRPEGCLEILEGGRHYFERYDQFREVYQPALAAEREKAREEIEALLLAASREETTLSQAHHFLNTIRRAAALFPAEESAGFLTAIEARIAELTPTPSEDELIRQYRYAARAGNPEKAARCRSHISDQAALDEFDVELAREFAIERSPVQLAWSDTLQVDLTSEPPLFWAGSSDRHIFFREADDAIVILHLERMTATRFSSPHFKDLYILDCIPPDDVFLLKDMKTHLTWWRAELSEEKSAFTACFDMREFSEVADDCAIAFFLSSERSTDYYALIRDIKDTRPAKVVRKRVGISASPISDSIKIGNLTEIVMRRLSWHPDKFIIGGKDHLKVCAKNLTSDYRVDMHPDDIWSIDFANRHLYYFDRAILKRTDLEFGETERFLESRCCFFFSENHRKLSLCPANSTLMVGVGPRCALYEFIGNRISAPFAVGRVVGTKPARKWYTHDYCLESRTLTLRDITADTFTILEWEDAVMPPENEEEDPDWHLKLHKQIYLGFKGGDQSEEPCEDAAAGEDTAPAV